ncbi:unnamed protein product [Schistocephalus solidus]|uniref:Uncharacterized protein n=1 Tax=Schistocephalus solidus TaxID=70667 RepID=A0A183TU76_SCHSO|nr:unnamed protein product [Schistocephalus solidus]
MYVMSNFTVCEKTEKVTNGIEAIWWTRKTRGSQSLEGITLYRPPRLDNDADTCLVENMKEIDIRPHVIFMGAFNAPISMKRPAGAVLKVCLQSPLLKKNLKLFSHKIHFFQQQRVEDNKLVV